MADIAITIDGLTVTAPEGATVLDAARAGGIYIPALCHDDDLEPYGACRMCVVEIDGTEGLPTACTTPVVDGMVVRTDTEQVNATRKMICELMIADHPQECLTCATNQQCDLQQLASHLGIDTKRLEGTDRPPVIDDSNPFFVVPVASKFQYLGLRY